MLPGPSGSQNATIAHIPTSPPTPPHHHPARPVQVHGVRRHDPAPWTGNGRARRFSAPRRLARPCCRRPHTHAHSQACRGICARLCTVAEMTVYEARGSGCVLDEARVWSSRAGDCPVGTALSMTGASPALARFPPQCSPRSRAGCALLLRPSRGPQLQRRPSERQGDGLGLRGRLRSLRAGETVPGGQ
jgi:hypothetical protein